MDALTVGLVVLGVVGILYFIARQRSQPGVDSKPMDIKVTVEYTPPKPTPDPGNPPDRNQLTKCERLGLMVQPGMTRRQVGEMIRQAMERPEIKARQDAYDAEQQAIAEAADREDYGDTLVDERKEWQARCDLKSTYMVAFKSGGKVVGDLMQFDSVEIEDAPKPFVKIEAMRPKVYRNPRDMSPHFDFEKEIALKPAQILAVEKVPAELDMFELEEFDKWQRKAQRLAEARQPAAPRT